MSKEARSARRWTYIARLTTVLSAISCAGLAVHATACAQRLLDSFLAAFVLTTQISLEVRWIRRDRARRAFEVAIEQLRAHL